MDNWFGLLKEQIEANGGTAITAETYTDFKVLVHVNGEKHICLIFPWHLWTDSCGQQGEGRIVSSSNNRKCSLKPWWVIWVSCLCLGILLLGGALEWAWIGLGQSFSGHIRKGNISACCPHHSAHKTATTELFAKQKQVLGPTNPIISVLFFYSSVLLFYSGSNDLS